MLSAQQSVLLSKTWICISSEETIKRVQNAVTVEICRTRSRTVKNKAKQRPQREADGSERRSEVMMSQADAAWPVLINQKSHDCTVSWRSVGILF